MRAFFLAAILVLSFGCAERRPAILGKPFDGGAISITALKQNGTNSLVILQGNITEKCPVAGCWFILRDDTGTIKVDTKNADFVVVDVPLNTSVIVAGFVMTNGMERFIDATGLRY